MPPQGAVQRPAPTCLSARSDCPAEKNRVRYLRSAPHPSRTLPCSSTDSANFLKLSRRSGRSLLPDWSTRERGKLDEAIAVLDKAISLDSRMALAYGHRCVCYRDLHEYAKAIEDADRAIALEPELAYALRYRAYAAHCLGQNESAISDLTKALQLEPGSKEEWNEKTIAYRNWLAGAIALKQGNLRAAIEQFDVVLEAVEQSEGVPRSDYRVSRVYNDRGDTWFSLSEYEHALRDYNEAVALEPDHPVYYINRAQTLIGLRRYVEAERDLVEATRRGPHNVHACAYLAWFRATCSEAEFRNGKQAVAMAHKAMELGSRQPGSRYCAILAAACAEDGNFAEAVRLQTERLAALPDKATEEQRLECERRLERYQAGIPHR